jgi:hypothetical protein
MDPCLLSGLLEAGASSRMAVPKLELGNEEKVILSSPK